MILHFEWEKKIAVLFVIRTVWVDKPSVTDPNSSMISKHLSWLIQIPLCLRINKRLGLKVRMDLECFNGVGATHCAVTSQQEGPLGTETEELTWSGWVFSRCFPPKKSRSVKASRSTGDSKLPPGTSETEWCVRVLWWTGDLSRVCTLEIQQTSTTLLGTKQTGIHVGHSRKSRHCLFFRQRVYRCLQGPGCMTTAVKTVQQSQVGDRWPWMVVPGWFTHLQHFAQFF